MIRRYLDGEARDAVPAALPLPPYHGKRRIAVSFPSGILFEQLPDVLLRDAREHAQPAWQTIIDALLALGHELTCPPRVFGSLLWQHLTGLPYLTDRSDLDLLWSPSDLDGMSRLVRRLAIVDAASPVRLDGEIILPDGGGVNWRELAGAPDEVLVKSMHSVEMRAVSGLFG